MLTVLVKIAGTLQIAMQVLKILDSLVVHLTKLLETFKDLGETDVGLAAA